MTDLFMIDDIIKSALREDVGTGDITTNSTIPADKKISGKFIAKESGVVCGLPVVERVFARSEEHTSELQSR